MNPQEAVPQTDPAQEAILEAVSNGITDPEQLRQLAGLPTLAAVKRTIDKLSIRREFHLALDKNQMSLEWLVKGIKDIADNGKETNRLAAFRMLLGSMGLNKFDDIAVQGKDWEEALLKLSRAQDPARQGADIEYDVKVPEMPQEMKKIRAEEKKIVQEMTKD